MWRRARSNRRIFGAGDHVDQLIVGVQTATAQLVPAVKSGNSAAIAAAYTAAAMLVTRNFARKSDVAVSAPADRSDAHAHAAERSNPCTGRGRRSDAWRISRARRRVLLVTYRCQGREAVWRASARYPVWHLLQSEYHTRSGNRYRPLDRRAVSASTPRRRAARRSELFPSVPVSELHRRRCSGDQGLFVLASPSAPGEPAARRGLPILLALPAN